MLLQELNEKYINQYNDTYKRIEEIMNETSTLEGEYKNYFEKLFNWALKAKELESKLNDEYFKNTSFEELKKENEALYEEIIKENYETCYANPTYGVKVFGDKLGQFFSTLYSRARAYLDNSFKHRRYEMALTNELFIQIYEKVKAGEATYEALTTLLRDKDLKDAEDTMVASMHEKYNPEGGFFSEFVNSSDENDLRYLFKTGGYVTDNEIKTAEFFKTYDEAKLEELTESMAKAYVMGFKKDNKDISLRDNVRIIYNMGQERMIKSLTEKFAKYNLKGYIAGIETTAANKQYPYDHRFDNALTLDEIYKNKAIENIKDGYEKSKELVSNYSGIFFVEKFGETPFAPKSKEESLKLSDEQSKLYQEFRNTQMKLGDDYMPEKETSFCIIAFPVPEIGEKFEEIFEDTLRINMMDTDKHERMQQCIIDALDKAEYVHVKGKDGNKTDIKVSMNRLNNPEKETNFVNCGADVNIPVGEVFTSPMLKGTEGKLHLDVVFLDELKYVDLELDFKDGYVDEYTCKNFEKEDENKKYVQENLLFPHKTLPLGEFAIGTNTLAYMIAEKHQIVDILPILIVEKMGPHFAIGDTCFSWGEDNPVYNLLDGKEIVARDNERSILRKEDVSKAYTGCHTDITIPYDSIGFISAVTKDGEYIEIIKDGRFVIDGTEELNKPFDEEK